MTRLNVFKPHITQDFVSGDIAVSFKVSPESKSTAKTLAEMAKDKYVLEIKEWRKKRSTTANAYMWVLLQKIAEVLGSGTTKDDVYLEMLERYSGKFTHIIVKQEAVMAVMNEWRACRNIGEVEVNGKKGIQLQVYYGSSTFNTKEMTVLLDGIVSECRELGIETDMGMKILLEGDGDEKYYTGA